VVSPDLLGFVFIGMSLAASIVGCFWFFTVVVRASQH
jgi:hypothetical protein